MDIVPAPGHVDDGPVFVRIDRARVGPFRPLPDTPIVRSCIGDSDHDYVPVENSVCGYRVIRLMSASGAARDALTVVRPPRSR